MSPISKTKRIGEIFQDIYYNIKQLEENSSTYQNVINQSVGKIKTMLIDFFHEAETNEQALENYKRKNGGDKKDA